MDRRDLLLGSLAAGVLGGCRGMGGSPPVTSQTPVPPPPSVAAPRPKPRIGLALGGGMLLVFHRSLGYYLATVGVPVVWPALPTLGLHAAGCVLLAAAIGLVGAAVPAWRSSGQEPYLLVRAEGN